MPTLTLTATLVIDDVESKHDLDVSFDWQPYEAMTHDYPGCDESIEISSVKSGSVELLDLITEGEKDMLTDKLWEMRNVKD